MTKESFLPALLSADVLNAKMEKPDLVFHGYCCDYRYGNFNDWEYSQTMFTDAWDKNDRPLNARQVGDCVGHASDSFWDVRVCSQPNYHSVKDYAKTIVWMEPWSGFNRAVPIELHHSDVLPSLLPGEELTIQVSMLPTTVKYHQNKTPEKKAYEVKPIEVVNEQDPFSVKNANLVHLVGGIHEVERMPTTDFEGEKIRVLISTRFGMLYVVHALDDVPKEEREHIRKRNFLEVTGYLMADCAVADYQTGAQFDEINTLKLLRDGLLTGRLFRFYRAMMPKCRIELQNEGIVFFENQEDHRPEILEKLALWFGNGRLYQWKSPKDGRSISSPSLLYVTPNEVPLAEIYFRQDSDGRIHQIVINPIPKDTKIPHSWGRRYTLPID